MREARVFNRALAAERPTAMAMWERAKTPATADGPRAVYRHSRGERDQRFARLQKGGNLREEEHHSLKKLSATHGRREEPFSDRLKADGLIRQRERNRWQKACTSSF